ncbi:MAG: hypothetical protein H6R19_1181 [Proteobacteria bacterium]|nr:hypothetical protein [Pseudomonadota bacterium]
MGRVNQSDKAALSGVTAALQRAGVRARELARQTHTPLVVYRNGKIEHQEMAASSLPAPKPSRQKR